MSLKHTRKRTCKTCLVTSRTSLSGFPSPGPLAMLPVGVCLDVSGGRERTTTAVVVADEVARAVFGTDFLCADIGTDLARWIDLDLCEEEVLVVLVDDSVCFWVFEEGARVGLGVWAPSLDALSFARRVLGDSVDERGGLDKRPFNGFYISKYNEVHIAAYKSCKDVQKSTDQLWRAYSLGMSFPSHIESLETLSMNDMAWKSDPSMTSA